MVIRNTCLTLTLSGAACLGLAAATSAQNTVVSVGAKYAYFLAVPGQPPNHYRDDGPINGPHLVHSTGLGVYDNGNLTDGAVSVTAGGGPNTTHLAFHSPGWNNGVPAPAADIIIDLGSVHVLSDITIGTVIAAASNNNPPDDVTISFSVAGTAAANFTGAQYYDLETMYGPLADGHHDLLVKLGIPVPAQYVKLSFDGGSMTEPGGQDPNEKYMLDEITIRAVGSNCTAASSNFGNGLAGTNGIPTLTVSAPPKFGANINLMGSNSSGATSTGLLIAGVQQVAIKFLGGTLLVAPLVEVGVTVPAGGLVVPLTVPSGACGAPICLHFLQLDSGATAGISMSQGLKLDFGT